MTERLLVDCSLCGCWVDLHTVRVRSFWRATEADDTLRYYEQAVCRDMVACFARASDTDHWQSVGARVPGGVEPSADATLYRCMLCDIAASVDDVICARSQDEAGWFSEVFCRDDVACDRRQRRCRRIEPPAC
ncbi:hypothetical protein [Streptomyces pinistramenti]|uniref:hypothetical protein n=1 Tax=Streptomyces pinistramenti TaxID=2884812 RepID=UPI001D0919A1|nr:hypothetical protein [Streptomyces pinistramenti]MCB5908331.1 hypothetical protein [Streptomyces pinistramenti]